MRSTAAIEQAELLAAELDREVGLTAVAGRDVIFLARRGPEALAASIGYPGDRTPLLAPIGAVFMAWAEDAAVDEWLARAVARRRGRRVLPAGAHRHPRTRVQRSHAPPGRPRDGRRDLHTCVTIPRRRTPSNTSPTCCRRSRSCCCTSTTSPPADKVLYKTVAAPIFDPIGRVLLSLSVTGPDHPVPVDEVLEVGRRVVRSAAVATRQGRGRSARAA